VTLHPPGPLSRLPRIARAYLAGLGTSGSLLICLALMFIVVSALVAFRGWPHVGAQPSPGEVVVSPQPVASTGSAVARRLVVVAAAPVGGARAPAGSVAGGVGARLRGPAPPATGASIGRPASATLPAGAPVAPTSGGGGATSCGTGCAPAPVVGSAPAPVQQLTQTAQQGIQRASGALGKVVGDTGSVRTAMQQTTRSAAGAVQTVSPPAATVVQNTGSGVSKVIGGLTNTAAGVLSGIGKP
jgi:hypothetical protein